MKKVLGLSINDMGNVQRDPMLLAALLGPVLLTLGVRYGIPRLDTWLAERFEFQLYEYNLLIVGFFMMIIPFLIGILVGLLILDDRDEQMILFYSVTPLGRQGYLLYRLASPLLLGIVFTLLMGALNGLVHLDLLPLLVLVVLFALEAPLIALAIANIASNKVEGLAVTKGFGVILAFPFLVYFVKTKWVWTAAFVPFFRPSKLLMFEPTPTGKYIALAGIGIIVHCLLIGYLMRRFLRQAD